MTEEQRARIKASIAQAWVEEDHLRITGFNVDWIADYFTNAVINTVTEIIEELQDTTA